MDKLQTVACTQTASIVPFGPLNGFLVPSGVLLLALLCAILLPEKTKLWGRTLLASSRGKRSAFAILSGFLGTAVFPLLLAFVDLPLVASERAVGKQEALLLCLSALVIFPYLAILSVTRSRDEELDRQVEAARNELAKATADAQRDIAEAKKIETGAVRQRTFAVLVGKTFLKLVASKRERLTKALAASGGGPGAAVDALAALNSREHIVQLVHCTQELFQHLVRQRSEKARVRVAYFSVEGDHLEVQASYDGTCGGCVASNLLAKYSRELSLNRIGCLAVWVSKKERWLMVKDAAAADRDPAHPFTFFDDRERIASIAAFPIRTGQDGCAHVLCIDTDYSGFFNEEELSRVFDVEALHDDLEQRFRLELLLLPFAAPPSVRST